MRLRPDRKTERQQNATKRNEAWRALSPKEQLELLNKRRGNSIRQRTKILKNAQEYS